MRYAVKLTLAGSDLIFYQLRRKDGQADPNSMGTLVADQELDVSVRYWEGAVDVNGHCGATEIRGQGYVELPGYAE